MNFSNYFALFLVLLSCLMSDANSRFRIFEGTVSDIKDKPYMVSLHRFSRYFCAGSLVNLKTVITAANCLADKRGEEACIKVIAGSTNMYAGGETRTVQRFIIPPTYDEETLHMDVAAIKLSSSFIESNEIKPIGLCDTDLKENTIMQVSGWGVRFADSTVPSANLRTIVLKTIPTRHCGIRYYKIKRPITPSMICAGYKTYTCDGDAGAPGVVNQKICTVASFGKGCGDCDYPGVYTNLNDENVLKFVQDSMNS